MTFMMMMMTFVTGFCVTSLRKAPRSAGSCIHLVEYSRFHSPRHSLRLFSSDASASPSTHEQPHDHSASQPQQQRQEEALSSSSSSSSVTEPISLYRSEGLLAVQKPYEWTSNDVVSYLRGMLEWDARQRGAKPQKLVLFPKVSQRCKMKKNNLRVVRVGHGGTLDPLATGVLVIGVGKGTKELQS